MEDGFLRSVGLGSDLRRPLSLVLDDAGIHYDPRSPSALEAWLEHGQASIDELERAKCLRARLVKLRLSKYNIGGGFALADGARGKRVILVPGQVESDASIRFGSPVVRTNLDLLEAVRAENPDAWIVFKPHPDVEAGNRRGGVTARHLRALCDEVASAANVIDCILLADEVHTMTSLAGFESLLHGKPVRCHGVPFYAGWGLTRDLISQPRRTRRLTLDELVYGVLIRYARYIDPHTLAPTSVERAVALLEAQRHEAGWGGLQWSPLASQWRKLRGLAQALMT
jgi:capsular polysaccharide export protein